MRRPSGAVLPLVLLALLVMAAVSFAMSFRVTLDAMAARSALSHSLAHAQAAAGLALAVAEQHAAALGGVEPPVGHGPWPQHAVLATVTVAASGAVAVPATDPPSDTAEAVTAPVLTLKATATVGAATATALVTLYFTPAVGVLVRR